MPPFTFTFEAGTNSAPIRKIAKPTKKAISTETRESVQGFVQSSEPRKFAHPKRKPVSDERRAAISAEEEKAAAVQ
jgi:hypothetical protein